MRRLGFVVAFLGWSAMASCQLTSPESQALSDALFLSNLELANLVKTRSEGGTAWTRTAINEPLAGIEQLQALQAAASQRSLPQLLAFLRTSVFADPATFESAKITDFEVPQEVPEPVRPSLKRLILELLACSDLVRDAAQKLSPAEKRTLIEALPRLAVGAADVKFDFVRQPLPESKTIGALLAKVDLPRIRFAAQRLAQAVQDELPKLREAARAATMSGTIKLTIQGVVVALGGMGDDIHSESDATLCIDLGGNDRYSGRYGAGVGYSSVLIDLAGDDDYLGPDLSFGAGVLGVGLAFDLGGDDRFIGKSLCFGAGIAGVGALLKDGGDDDYRTTALSQGFGFHGIGILLDTKGEDHYRVKSTGQGAARDGGMGWLLDKSGDDQYQSDGLGGHAILREFKISSSQGFGDGAGALGCLSDLAGNDSYRANAQAQGSGSREGIGVLMDSQGRDDYLAGHEAHAHASLGGAGYLIESDGDDLYALRLGNGHAFASNHGLAVLIDRKGSDLYAGRDSRPGSATANGTSVFLDAEGDDGYSGQPGIGGLARGTGSIGVFADLSGNDRYAEGMANGVARAQSSWGSAVDQSGLVGGNATDDPPKPGSKPQPGDAAMDALYANAMARDRPAIDELIAIGEPALRWLLARKLGADPTATDLIGWLAVQVGGSAEDLCVAAIDLTKESVARDAILICQFAGYQRAGPRIVDALELPALQRVAVRAAGAIAIAEAVPKLLEIGTGTNAQLKHIAIISLGQIGDPRAMALMEAQAEVADPEMRLAAVHFLAKHPIQGLTIGQRLIGSNLERTSRTGIELLSEIGSPDALAMIGKALSDPRRGVQIQCLIALDTRVPREFWPNIVELRKSSDPLVKAVASRIDLGR